MDNKENSRLDSMNSNGEICHVQLATILKLKDSTRKLLCLLEEIQSKAYSTNLVQNNCQLTESIKPAPDKNYVLSVTDVTGANALQRLESQAKNFNAVYVEDEEHDCSIYKRLTGKCLCLNRKEYNDFIIHFNEDTKYFTSNTGEIIKNMRILKKFLYMCGSYTKQALMFLNEGLSESLYSEKLEITQACSHADICNIFEEHSIVTFCISLPWKANNYGETTIQVLAASFLYKLSLLEEGRRYLKYSSKITNDIKKLLRKTSTLDYDTLDTLNATLNQLYPPINQNIIMYYCKPFEEGLINNAIKPLLQSRQYMTIDEVFTHLDLLKNISLNENGKSELTKHLPTILNLFKNLLIEFNNSEMNIILTMILNNIVSNNIVEKETPKLKDGNEIKDIATSVRPTTGTPRHIEMRNESIHMPSKKNSRKINKSKTGMSASPNRFRQESKRKVGGWEILSILNKSKKYSKADSRNSIIVVPIEE